MALRLSIPSLVHPEPCKSFLDSFHLNSEHSPDIPSLVAITGLAGRAFESWQTKNGQMWLRDFSAPNHTDCRFFTFGYPSKVRQSQQQATISDFVENFVEEIKTISSKQEVNLGPEEGINASTSMTSAGPCSSRDIDRT